MRKLGIFIGMLVCCVKMMGQAQTQSVQPDAEKKVMNCAVMLGTAMDMVTKGQQTFDVRAFADTLYHGLYTNPVELKDGSRYMAKIYLQAFFATSQDKRIDYPDIERCLAVAGKHEAFYTLPFILCTYYYSQWAKQEGLTDKEIAAMQLGLKAHDKLYPDSTTFFSQSMNISLSGLFYQQKKWSSAAKYTERALADLRRLGENDSDDYFGMLLALASCYQLSGNNAKADSCLLLVQQHLEKEGLTTTEDYVELLIDRAELQEALGHDDESERLLLLAKKGLRTTDESYHNVMLQLAQQYTELEQHEKTMSVVKEELSFYEKTPPTGAKSLLPWIVFCNNPLSTNEGDRLVALLKKMQDGTIESMAVLAYAYCHAYQYEKARNTAYRIEQMFDKLSIDEKEELVDCLQPLYTALNDFDRQIELSKLQVASVKKVVGDQHDLYIRTLSLLGTIYGMKGDYTHCIQLLDSCLTIPGIEPSTKMSIYDNLSEFYATMGDFQKSNYYASMVLNQTENVSMTHQLMGRIVVNLISELEIRRLDVDEQGKAGTDSLRNLLLDYAKKSLEFCRSNFGEGHLSTIEAMEYLASAYYLSDNLTEMKETTEACERTIRQHLKNPQLQKTYLQGLSVYYQKSHQYQKALELVDTTCLQKPNTMFAELKGTLEPLAELNLDLGRYTQAQHYFNRLARSIINETSSQMTTLTSQARQYYWRLSRQTLAGSGKYILQTGQPDSFAGTIYDLALYTKDIMLSSEQGFVRAVRSTGDESLMNKMQQMLNLRTALVENTVMIDEERTAKTQYAQQLEQELIAACKKELKDDLDKQHPNWQEIQQALPDSAMAVEMVQYKTRDEADCYGAVMLRKDWSAPVFVQIGDKKRFDCIAPQDLSIKTGKMVWQFLKPYQENLRTLYFSPIGIFHKLPIEYMPLDGLDVLSERLRVYRLSSTSQPLRKHNEQGTDAVVYGGLEFAMSVKEMKQDAERHRGAGDVKELKYLEGTAIEADSIVSLINNRQRKGMSARLYSGKAGTEASFKALSGQRKLLIHIGTHGAYAPDENVDANSLLTRSLHQRVNTEDNALSKSVLYFAGADNKLNNEFIPEGVDDGKLTAQEVSTLDFRGLELVTLSACQSAEGRITSDGVFGLQRGFKKAGAQSILMSLWKVNDEATCLLMTEFYRNWIGKGKTKHDALELAKQTVRSHKEKGWDDPKYWAAFILLDALD